MNIPDISLPEVRLEVYEKALAFIEAGKRDPLLRIDMIDPISLLLPCLWLNAAYNELWRDSFGNIVDPFKMYEYFPEVESFINDEPVFHIVTLREIIAEMKSNLTLKNIA